MYSDPVYRPLLLGTLVAVLICAGLVTVCYFFVDRQVALFVHDHRNSRPVGLEAVTHGPEIAGLLTAAILGILMVRRARGPLLRWEIALFAACISLIVAEQFRLSLEFVFGRYWPATWTNNNPSLIEDGAYGFHPFHSGPWYGSFPSGHTARTLGAMSVFWIAYPRWRWLWAVPPVLIPVSLVGMNYHFVGDTVAGGFVGAIVGTYAANLCGLVPANVRETGNPIMDMDDR